VGRTLPDQVATQPSRKTPSPARRSTPSAALATAALGGGRFGPFRLLDRLPASGPVEQYHALWSEAQAPNERLCLLRRLPVELNDSPSFARMFAEESRIMGRLCHPNVVRAYAAGEIEGAPYLALEYLDGLTLAQVATARRAHRERLPLEVAIFIAHEVAAALGYAYDAIGDTGQPMHLVHGDLRPARVAILSSGEVKLTDLGATRVVSFVRASGPAPGVKPLHSAPELLAGATPDPRSDLFSLGVLLWELVCNQPLFPSVTSVRESAILRPSRVRTDLPPALDGLIMQLLERNPARRKTSAEEVRRALAPLVPIPADAERALAAMIRDGVPVRGLLAQSTPGSIARRPSLTRLPALSDRSSPAPVGGRRPGPARRPVTRVVPQLAEMLRQQGKQLARALPESVRRITGLLSPVPVLHAPTPPPAVAAPVAQPAIDLLAFTTRPRSQPGGISWTVEGWLRRVRIQISRLAAQAAMIAFVAFLTGVVWQELRSSASPVPQLVESQPDMDSVRGVVIQPLEMPSEIVVVETASPPRPSARVRPAAGSSRTSASARSRPARGASATARGTAH
jgi:serine/threonine protein kinase